MARIRCEMRLFIRPDSSTEMQFVRQSKFRHVFAKPLKREFLLEDVKITKISWDGLFCAVNTKFIAVITEGSGGPFSVFPISKVGRLDKDYPVVDAHRAPCLEIAWCPFNENVIASGSEDCSVKVWHIPDGGLVRPLKEPIVELVGHQKRVCSVVWHPSASNILLTAAADLKIFIWNVGTGEPLIEIAGHPDLIWSVDFNYNGSKIVTTCKDKKIRVIDPRTGRILQQGIGHEGVKPQRAIFLKDGRIFTTGFTKRSERMYALRNEETLEEPIIQEELDTSNGVLVPLSDPDTGLLYLVGKGDSTVRYYEINNDPPYVHFINVYTTSEPQRGIGFMPKRGLNINENEIARVYKVTNKGIVDVLQFFVPRKSELFQEDLYPDTAAATAAISADEWMNGRDADPVLMPLKGNKCGPIEARPQGTVKKSNILAQMATASSGGGGDAQPTRPPIQTSQLSADPDSTEPTGVVMRKGPKIDADSGIISVPNQPPANYRNSGPPPDTGRSVGHPPSGRQERDAGVHTRSAGDVQSLKENFSGSGRGGAGGPGRYGRQASRESVQFSSRDTTPRQSVGPDGGTNGVASKSGSGAEYNMEELVADMQKLKQVIRKHERRIRHLEEHLAERDMLDFDNL